MKKHWIAAVIGLVTIAALPVVASAEGWLPNVNPFGSKKEEPSTLSGKKTPSSSSDDSSWSLSGKKPQASQSSARSSSEPSTWDKFASGTSNTVKKTGSYLNPWHKETTPPPKPSGSRGYNKSSARTASAKKSTSENTWYNPTTWFGSNEQKPKKTESVSSFLGQKRPKN